MFKKIKKLIIIFLVSSFYSSICLSNDIKEFEIGEISVGKSLLEFVNENQIDFIRDSQQYPKDKYIIYDITKILTIEGFDFVDVMTKKNDKKYIIVAISAAIYYDELDECLKLKTEIQKEIESLFNANDKQETKFPSKQDSTGKSMVYGAQYYTQPYPSNEAIIVNCYHMTKDSNIKRALRVSVNTHEYASFIINELYD